ncbi:MAG: transposase, partial [Dongiaceae bacterium]
MQDRDLLQMALGLTPPWRVVRSEFDAAQRRLDIRHLWLRNPTTLSPTQAARLEALNPSKSHLQTARAYRIRLAFQDLYKQSPQTAGH